MATVKRTFYLPPELDAKVIKAARDQHRSESSIILEAVRMRLERGEATNAAIEESARRQLSRVDARLEKVIGESLILKEIMLFFVQVWLEYNPPIEEHLAESAAASAEARFERFMDAVAQALAHRSLGDELAQNELIQTELILTSSDSEMGPSGEASFSNAHAGASS